MAAALANGPLSVGLAGLGTVGAGVVRLLAANADLVAARAGRPIRVSAVSARDRARARGVDLSPFAWEDDATRLAARDDVDVVVELVGGADGPALTLARATLGAGKPLVTANKAMLAHHGLELAMLAETAGAALRFEAAVAGGIPVIKGLREGAAANRLARVYGILNGTCNYILSRMAAEGLEFADVLADAQAHGYAEADPSFDIDGVDAAHKLALLSALAFGTPPDLGLLDIEGIRQVRLADVRQAEALGYEIRLVGLAERHGEALAQRVAPCLVPRAHPLASVTGPLNAVVAEGDFVGRLLFVGAGAGAGPTASAVVADLIAIARGESGPAFSTPAAALAPLPAASPAARAGRFYLRLRVEDRPGVLADLTAILRDAGVSIESLNQPASGAEGTALVVMVTHDCAETAARAAVASMARLPAVAEPPLLMPLLPTEGE
ncbi:homoserine dehydrogenase [Thermaurantiacus tibetensis]|uniref:homoserine dehydrogenase n=1 Tax=Thermaurantiacus tibetensis TaxID=2759035 RepID=UPI00188F9DEF|nr:homoserine dehydrogenase [Thermaurantiacus tibetensis]